MADNNENLNWWQRGLAGALPPFNLYETAIKPWFQRAPNENIFGITSTKPTQMSPYGAGILEQTGGLPAGVTVAPTSQASTADRVAAMKALRAAQGGGEEATIKTAVKWDVIVDPDTQMMVLVGYDEDGNVVTYEPQGLAREAPSTELSPSEKESLGLEREQLELAREKMRQDAEMQQQQMAAQQANQQAMLNWYREQQAAQLEADRQTRLAQLRANPASWLEYASLSGETPAIQPWMLPLMPQQYGFQAGEALPNWTTEGSLSNLPELTTPSAQYLSRISPSSREQFYGYQGAKTGATPEDIEWRAWSNAPPSGQYSGLRRTR